MSLQAPPASPAAASAPRVHLGFLDGLRGLAALYVVAHHAYHIGWQPMAPHPPGWLEHATNWLFFGQAGVCIFIVLSGFCLMLPVARSANGQLSGGVWEFVKRRARRILPPYYAALLLSGLLVATVPALSQYGGVQWTHGHPVFGRGVLVSHLLLFHNFKTIWEYKIDYPMWSVATEWQIYFVFALVLLPLWRRLGLLGVMVAALVLSRVLYAWYPRAFFDLITAFALGMAGAALCFAPTPTQRRWCDRLPWGTLAATIAVAFGVLTVFRSPWLWTYPYQMNRIVGAATFCFLMYCTRRTLQGRVPGPWLRGLQARPTVALGAFSYSLYLVHAPVLAVYTLWVRPLRLSAVPSFCLEEAGGIALALVVAYGFHLLFEKPFLTTRRVKNAEHLRAENAAIVDAPAEGDTREGWETSPP